MGVSADTVAALRGSGHDVVHVRDIGFHERLDSDILAEARAQGRVVVTFDLDFGDLLAAGGESLPSVILVRTHNQRPEVATPRVMDVVQRFAQELESGILVVVEDSRFRFRRLPLR